MGSLKELKINIVTDMDNFNEILKPSLVLGNWTSSITKLGFKTLKVLGGMCSLRSYVAQFSLIRLGLVCK